MLLRVNEQRNILHEVRKRKANWIGQVLSRNSIKLVSFSQTHLLFLLVYFNILHVICNF